MFDIVENLEQQLAEFFGAPYCVATDCCTHALELCLRHLKPNHAVSPTHTYLSVPFTFEKLSMQWSWKQEEWHDYYYVSDRIIDAAVFWKQDGYIPGTFMCLSFQFRKHLKLGRGGCILLDDKESYQALKRMSYDGRDLSTPWAEQDITEIGYHYYMTPETAKLGLSLLPDAIKTEPQRWSYRDYPNISKMAVFQ